MSTGPKDVEVERAKSQLKASLLLSLDGTTAIAEDIGRQLVTSGHRFSPKQIENAVDAVSTDDVKRVAQKYLWDQDVSGCSSAKLFESDTSPTGCDRCAWQHRRPARLQPYPCRHVVNAPLEFRIPNGSQSRTRGSMAIEGHCIILVDLLK